MVTAAIVILSIIVFVAAAELALRLMGVINFPLFDANARIGYIPRPQQIGVFAGRAAWEFNERSMGTWRPFEPGGNDIVLVGDSIVFGGNNYRTFERLGPQLELATRTTVWPISAPSWALQNELQYLLDNPDVLDAAARLVIVVNRGDFGSPASWYSPIVHPRSRPHSALIYLLRKRFGRRISDIEKVVPEEQYRVPRASYLTMFREVAERFGKPIDVVFYADRVDFVAGNYRKSAAALDELEQEGARIHLATTAETWSREFYADSIHPTPAGARKLAATIALALGYQPAVRPVTTSAAPKPTENANVWVEI